MANEFVDEPIGKCFDESELRAAERFPAVMDHIMGCVACSSVHDAVRVVSSTD